MGIYALFLEVEIQTQINPHIFYETKKKHQLSKLVQKSRTES